MQNLIGRKPEIKVLEKLKDSPKSAFVAIYGRRRVGKTYLVRQLFEQSFSFYLTGVTNTTTRQLLSNFYTKPYYKISKSRAFQIAKRLVSSLSPTCHDFGRTKRR